MNLIAWARYHYRIFHIMPSRYAHLFRAIHERKCRKILEIGVFDGVHAKWMIETAHIHHPMHQIEYHGVDLFELLTDELFQKELAKRPPARRDVEARLHATGANIYLHQGNSRHVLPALKEELGVMDIIFIDGGHSFETISADWKNVQPFVGPRTIVLFDDYLLNDEADVRNTGCQALVDSLDLEVFSTEVLEPVNYFPQTWGVLKTTMARVSRKVA